MLSDLSVDPKSEEPLVRQIQRNLRDRIDSGKLEPGTRLCSMRELAAQLSVSVGIVKQAMNTLTAEGYLVASPRRGLFVGRPKAALKEIALVLPTLEHEQMLQVIRGVRHGLRGSGYHMVTHAADSDFADQIQLLGRMDFSVTSGMLIYPPRLMKHIAGLRRLSEQRVPCVQVVKGLDPELTNAVVVDGVEMGRMGFDYVLERGHRKIGFVDVHADAPTNVEMRDGAAIALHRFGLTWNALAVTEVAGDELDQDSPWAKGEEAATQLLRDHPDVTVIIGADPHVTLGVFRAIKAAGKRVGDDISVLGLGGDLPTFGILEPAITAIDEQIEELCHRAVQRLRRLIENADTRVYSIYGEPRLIERNSVRRLT